MSGGRLHVVSLILTLLVFSSLTQAQQSNTTAEKTQDNDAALKEKAINLLESLADQISILQSAENRARLRSNIAGSLWTHDEKRGRALLEAVEDDIKAGLQNSLAEEPIDVPTFQVFLQLRRNAAERIAKHDVELALVFFKSTQVVSDKPLPYGVAENERAFELRLAKEIAANNPELALKLGRESLSRGFSSDLLSLLAQLTRKNKDLGNLFYKEIVYKLRNTNLTEWHVMNFMQNLASRFKPPFADELAFRELITMVITSALANGCGKKKTEANERFSYCYQIGALVPDMFKVDPSRAAQLKHWLTEDGVQFESPEASEAQNELNWLSQEGTVDEILALVSKYPNLEQQIGWHAITKSEIAGDYERSRTIAKQYVKDPEAQQVMLARIDRDQKAATMNEEKLAEIQGTLSRMRNPQAKLGFLLTMVNRIEVRDRNIALKLLSQADAIVNTMKPGREQTQAQIGLAAMYCLAKSDRGFAIIESIIPKLNELVSAAMKLDNYDNRYVRDGEWNMTGEGGLGSLLTNLARDSGYFAWCDFDRAVSLAAQFERPEIRMMAQLKLAQAILAGPPSRLSGNAIYIR